MNTLWLADNQIGDDGAKAIAAALEPRKNPDDSWVYNEALKELYLGGESLAVSPALCAPLSASVIINSTGR